MDDGIAVGTANGEEAAGICATCGRPLTQCGPNGECLRCLVSLGFLGQDEQPERPVMRGRLTPGTLRYAHFEVETGADGFPVELGAGAMAITYRARDTVLNSLVALKVIDRKVAQNSGARSRFLREARAAANIRHPNVARVTYYGEQDGECFYAMELVDGETLEARVRRDGRDAARTRIGCNRESSTCFSCCRSLRRCASRYQAIKRHARIGFERDPQSKAD